MDLKKLKQVARLLKQNTLPILDSVKLYGNNAVITDIQTCFCFKTHLNVEPSIVDISHFIAVGGNVEDDLKKLGKQEFPELPILRRNEGIITFKEDELNLFYDALAFVGHDDLRPAMNHFCITQAPDDGGMFLCATDAHKAYFKELKIKKNSKELLIPSDLIRILKIFKPYRVEMSIHDKHIALTFNDMMIITKIKENMRFPNLFRVIPSKKSQIVISKCSLVYALKTLLPYSDQSNHRATLNIGKKDVFISSEDEAFELNKKLRLYAFLSTVSKPIEIGFNIKFLQTLIKCIKGEDVYFNYSEANRAIVLNDYLLMMPQMIAQ